MSTVVQTNVLALNSHRNLGLVGNAQNRASARLSSGFRINSAADDAAGLAISEKMRAQIRGLDQASRNGQDGISLIQTAEGAMNIVNDMVIRIRELVVQASNDTNAHDASNLPQSDRQQIQREINQLLQEVDDMTVRTEFNTRTLLDGSLAGDPLRGLEHASVASLLDSTAMGNAITGVANATSQLESGRAALATFETNRDLLVNLYNRAATIDINDVIANIIAHVDALDTTAAAAGDPPLSYADMLSALDAIVGFTLSGQLATTIGIGVLTYEMVFIEEARNGTLSIDHFHDIAATQDSARDAFVQNHFASQLVGFSTVPPSPPAAQVNEQGFNIATGLSVSVQADAITLPPHGVGTASDLAELRTLITEGYYGTEAHANATQSVRNREANLREAVFMADTLVSNHPTVGQMFDNWADLEDAVARHAAGDVAQGLWFHIGANAGQGINLNIEAVNVNELTRVAARHDRTVTGFNVADLRNEGLLDGSGVMLESGEDINQFLGALDAALAHVSGQRAHLGAVQNRLEFTIESLDISSENLSAANSRIRDADMAAEMMRFTQSNVLQQAAISMLAQANQAPQSVLQLLR